LSILLLDVIPPHIDSPQHDESFQNKFGKCTICLKDMIKQ
jgi:hypothetical protein